MFCYHFLMQIWSNPSYIFNDSFDGYRKSHCRKLTLPYCCTFLHPVSWEYPYSWLPATALLLPLLVPPGSCYQKPWIFVFFLNLQDLVPPLLTGTYPNNLIQLSSSRKSHHNAFPKQETQQQLRYKHLPRGLENKIILLRGMRLKLWYPLLYSEFLQLQSFH